MPFNILRSGLLLLPVSVKVLKEEKVLPISFSPLSNNRLKLQVRSRRRRRTIPERKSHLGVFVVRNFECIFLFTSNNLVGDEIDRAGPQDSSCSAEINCITSWTAWTLDGGNWVGWITCPSAAVSLGTISDAMKMGGNPPRSVSFDMCQLPILIPLHDRRGGADGFRLMQRDLASR